MIGENGSRQTPSTADLNKWVDDYGATYPVVADENFAVAARYVNGSSIGLPSHTLIGPGGVVSIADGHPSDADIEALLPQ